MSTVSTFGAFTTARLGIYSSSKWLDVIGNNISNINTEGYTRQAVDQVSLYVGGGDKYRSAWDARVGNGGLVTRITQMRDPYMDIRYRTEISSVGAMDARASGLKQISSILDEVAYGEDADGNLGVLELQFNNLISQMEMLTGIGAGDDQFDTNVRTSAASVCDLFNSYADRLETLRENSEKGLEQDIKDINDILSQIRELNESIRKANVYGGDALEQKDQRNLLIDQLAEYMRIDVKYEMEHLGGGLEVEKLVISLSAEDGNNAVLVDGIYYGKLSIQEDQFGNPDPYYRLQVGQLKDDWGEVRKGSEVVELGDNTLYGALQEKRELLTERGAFATQEQLDMDSNAAIKRGIPFYQQALDVLAGTFAGTMNGANSGYKTVSINGQLYYEVTEDCDLLTPGVDYPASLEAPGLRVPENGVPTADQLTHLQSCGTGISGGVLFSNSGNGDDATGITAANISISKGWSTGDVRIAQGGLGSTANDNYYHMLSLLQEDHDFGPMFRGSFQEMFSDFICGTLAADRSSAETMLRNYSTAADELYVDRDAVSGVDLNDETMNLMQVQKSLTAAYRLMTVIDDMLERLISGTGVTR